jgi:hypothetical protein
MPNQQLAKVQNIDPEFAAAYREAEPVPRSADPLPANPNRVGGANIVDSDDEDPLLALKRIAETNMRNARKSSDCDEGFDRVENDVSNVIKTCWDFVTR